MIPIISIVAFSGTGKTTYMEKLIPALKGRGLRIAVVKHDGHGFEIDKEGKDSYRITKAGSDVTGLISKDKAVLMENRPRTARQFLSMIKDVDLILTEGYKSDQWPKIMLYREAVGKGYACPPEECLAVVSDDKVEKANLKFSFSDIDLVAEFITHRVKSNDVIINPLINIPFLKDVRPETLQDIWNAGRIMEVPKNTKLIEARKEISTIYFQLSGQSKIYTLTNNGNRKVIFVLGKGTMLNDHVVPDNHFPSLYCETMLPSQILAIPANAFLSLMQRDFNLTKAVLHYQEWKMWRMGHQLKNTTSSIMIERKLAAKLWKLCKDFHKNSPEGLEIDVNLSITFLSEMLGVPRETASRACKTLVEHGFIRTNKKRITILDPEGIVSFYKSGLI